jgi:methylmalonyl-CoA mutase N-terminal domain/subunit
MGGAIHAIETGFVQNEIGESAYRAQRTLEEKQSIVVGVNDFIEPGQSTLPILTIDEAVETEQVARLRDFRVSRGGDSAAALAALDAAARGSENVMPRIVDCVRSECTIGEIVATLKRTFGEHRDSGF